ncbi:hypothetical protein E2C01_000548 [Portunus trituberculatus]|uniref:Uncharacterized protein n=1 Tax=Portunus trituberculatus TaxID=210409 RepID=A0A5B7CEM8_PORTR|nr:hypothetical protein [Portunus trituberculatus]
MLHRELLGAAPAVPLPLADLPGVTGHAAGEAVMEPAIPRHSTALLAFQPSRRHRAATLTRQRLTIFREL